MSKYLGYIVVMEDKSLVKDQYGNVIVFAEQRDAIFCGRIGTPTPLIKYNKPRTRKKSNG